MRIQPGLLFEHIKHEVGAVAALWKTKTWFSNSARHKAGANNFMLLQ